MVDKYVDNQDIDNFFNFHDFLNRAPTKPANKTPIQDNTIVPKPIIEKKIQRNFVGTEYVKKYQTTIQKEKDLSQAIGGMNLTGLTTANEISFDDSALFDTCSKIDFSEISDHRKDHQIFEYHEEIIKSVRNNSIVMILGPTGCGKSTQVPQYILDDSAYRKNVNILISQPRKIAAISLAHRVAKERNTTLGTDVGYQVGLNRCTDLADEPTKMTFCTTGVILQKLLKQKSLDRYTHIILDEVHERDIDMDFLITIIRRLQPTKSNTKIILMSATLEVQKFQDFWKIQSRDLENEFVYPPIIDLDARKRTHEIIERYIDDIRNLEISPDIFPTEPGITNEMYSFVFQLLLMILRSAAKNPNRNKVCQNILVFLPGLPEIERLQAEFRVNDNMSKLTSFEPEFHVLHSSLSVDQQQQVFENPKMLKIILSTNIAESSLTIPNVSYVIDFCLTKHLKSHKGSQMSTHVLAWASKNNCKQRAGRTGRVSRGTVFRLVYKDFYYRHLLDHPIPEMKLAPLESIIVKIKDFNMGSPLEILADSLDPPDESSIVNAVLCLKEHGGLTIHDKNNVFEYHDGELTYLGEIMAALPCDIRITKLIVFGYLFSVLTEAIIIAAGLNFKAVFLNTLTNRMANYSWKVYWSQGTGSDCLATFNAYTFWYEYYRQNYFKSPDEERIWCRDHGLDVKILHELRVWIDEIRKRLKYHKIMNLPHPNQPKWSQKEVKMILKVIMAGAFGIANFFVTDTHKDMNKDAFSMFFDLDPFRTVYCRNMDKAIIGDVYKTQLKQTLVEKEICDENCEVNVTFDAGSERVYIMFGENKKEVGFSSGVVAPEVYKALKLYKLEGKIQLAVLTAQETVKYAIQQGFESRGSSAFEINYPAIECPEHWAYPLSSTHTVKGYVTHVVHCNKFYFCPLVGYSTANNVADSRYEDAMKTIRMGLKSFSMDALQDFDKVKPGQLVIYKNADTNENERAELIRLVDNNIVEILLIDVGKTRETSVKFIYKVSNHEEARKLEKYPPRVFECKLKELTPSYMNSYNNKWTPKAIKDFTDGVLRKNAVIEVYSIVANIVTVVLTIIDGENLINWNRKLLTDRHGQECEESYTSRINYDRRQLLYRSYEKPVDAKLEFAGIIDERYKKTHEIKAPISSRCDRVINLIGPHSPLETNLRAISADISGYVNVDGQSINNVLLNDEILSLHDKFYVAGDVSIAARNGSIKIRETTEMPNIPGLSVLLAMIFCPIAQLRRDSEKTRYISIITGLGLDDDYGKSYFYERDAIQFIDVNLQEDDIADVNRLRFSMSLMLHRDPFHKLPDLNDGQREQRLKTIKEIFTTIISKKRTTRDIQMGMDSAKWNVDQSDSVCHTSRIGYDAIWKPISIPPLSEITNRMKNELIRHALALENPNSMICCRECKLCGKSLDNSTDLKLHLMSKLHLLRKEQLGMFEDKD